MNVVLLKKDVFRLWGKNTTASRDDNRTTILKSRNSKTYMTALVSISLFICTQDFHVTKNRKSHNMGLRSSRSEISDGDMSYVFLLIKVILIETYDIFTHDGNISARSNTNLLITINRVETTLNKISTCVLSNTITTPSARTP